MRHCRDHGKGGQDGSARLCLETANLGQRNRRGNSQGSMTAQRNPRSGKVWAWPQKSQAELSLGEDPFSATKHCSLGTSHCARSWKPAFPSPPLPDSSSFYDRNDLFENKYKECFHGNLKKSWISKPKSLLLFLINEKHLPTCPWNPDRYRVKVPGVGCQVTMTIVMVVVYQSTGENN